MKVETQSYSVQPLNPDGSKDGPLLRADATSAQLAAEKALGVRLSLHGRSARAMVWVMNDSLKPTLVTLYLPEVREDGVRDVDRSS